MIIDKAIEDIKDLIFFYATSGSHFYIKEEEEIDTEKAKKLINQTICDLDIVNKGIQSGNLKCDEEKFYDYLEQVIQLNTKFHSQQFQTEEEKKLQKLLIQKITDLNSAITNWNDTHEQKIMTLSQAKEKYKKAMLEGLKFFPY